MALIHALKDLLSLIYDRDLAGVERILDENPAVSTAAHPHCGTTALMHACFYGRLDAARLLIARGADPRARCALGRSTMHNAAIGCHRRNDTALLDLLLEAGAEGDELDHDGVDALGYLATFRKEAVYDELAADMRARLSAWSDARGLDRDIPQARPAERKPSL